MTDEPEQMVQVGRSGALGWSWLPAKVKLQFIRDALHGIYCSCTKRLSLRLNGGNFYSNQQYKNTNTLPLIGIETRLHAGMPVEVIAALAG